MWQMGAHLERSGVRYANREISKHGQCLVHPWAPECEVVCDFMDGEEKVMVRRPTNNIGTADEDRRRPRCMSEEVCYGKLKRHHKENDPFCERLVPHKLRHLPPFET